MGFFWEFQALDPGEVPHVPKTFGNVTLSVRQGILYCPWCGANLREHYKRQSNLPWSELDPQNP